MSKSIIFFDLETTGVDTTKDKIVQISSIKLNPDLTPVDGPDGQWKDMLLNPGIPIPQGATEVHGITNEMVQGKPAFPRIAIALQEYLSGCDIAGYNILNFDVPLLSEEFGRVGIIFPEPGTRFVDVMRIFQNMIPKTLTGAVKFFLNKDLDGAHNAANDVKATIEVFQAQREKWDNIKNMSGNELHEYCVGEGSVDLAGKIKLNSKGEAIYAIGKDSGKVIWNNPSFARWMLNPEKSSFPAETRSILNKILSAKTSIYEDIDKPS